jgi:hypothetical protein
MPTGALASRVRSVMREKGWKNVDVDTSAAAFGLMDRDFIKNPALAQYAFIYVDEVSQHNDQDVERILKLWQFAGKRPVLLLSGDKYQCAGHGAKRPWQSRMWERMVVEKHLHRAYRCKDRVFWGMLEGIKQSAPTKKQLQDFCRRRKAWSTAMPTERDMRRLLKKHPNTVMMTCTRKGAAYLNNLVNRVKHPRKEPLIVLPGDPESNPENYRQGRLKEAAELKNADVPIYRGTKLFLTDNVRKEDDYVNGMSCVVEKYCVASKALRVRTDTGRRLMIFRWNNAHRPGAPSYYPIRQGYASTILKFQGATVDHATIWLDAPKVKGAAYTALSRVRTRHDYLLGGFLLPAHMTPAVG